MFRNVKLSDGDDTLLLCFWNNGQKYAEGLKEDDIVAIRFTTVDTYRVTVENPVPNLTFKDLPQPHSVIGASKENFS